MREGLQLTIPKRMGFIRIILTITLLLSVLLSPNLWCGERTFPHIPVWDNFVLNEAGEYCLLLLYCLLLIASLFLRKERLLLFLSIVVAFVFVISDLNRLQPWFYFYNAMLLIFVFYNGRVDDANKFTSYFIILQLIFASVYFYCGINRFGSFFIDNEFNNTIVPLQNILSTRHYLFFIKVGVIIPYLLVFVGLGLVITPLRYLAFAIVILFHVCLFFLLFPSFNNLNYPLWLSNLAFIFIAIFLFSGKTKQRYFSPTFLIKMPLFYMICFLFLIAPIYSKFGLWPNYLSCEFKNEKKSVNLISVNAWQYERLSLYQKGFCKKELTNYAFDYHAWCSHELNVSCYNEEALQSRLLLILEDKQATSLENKQLALKLK